LLALDAPVRTLATGFAFVEGPVWHAAEQYLLFSDIPADTRWRWDSAGGARLVAHPTGFANGLTYDKDLHLLVCEHAPSAIARYAADGRRSVLASRFEGRELNSPNDLAVRADGSIYFTDPLYGRMKGFGVERVSELGFQGVYRLPPGGSDPQLLVDRAMFTSPNGLCFSPDERLLYVNDTDQANIRMFDVLADGSLQNGRVFASGIFQHNDSGVRDDSLGAPDGMKCDQDGNVWVTAPSGLWVYAPDQRLIGKIRTPERTANLHWGGVDWSTLYLTATSSVYALDTRTRGRQEVFMR
jgi:gluconolactonase